MARRSVLFLTVIAGVLLALVALRWTRLDGLAWYAWNIAGVPGAALENAINLKRYRVDIERRPLAGVPDDVSALTYNPARDTLLAVVNSESVVIEMTLEGAILRRIRVHGAQDLEGLTHVAGNRYVIAGEREQRLWVVHIEDDTRAIFLDRAPSLTLAIDVAKNRGFEGLAYHQAGRRLLVVKESNPLRVLAITGFVDPDRNVPLDIRITEVLARSSPGLFLKDLSSLALHEPSGNLMLLSDRSKLVVEFDRNGNPISMLPLWGGFRGLKTGIPQAEGVAMDSEGRLYIVSEPNLFYRFRPDRGRQGS